MVKGSDMEHRDMDLTRISWDVSPSYGYTMHSASNKKICIYFFELNLIMLHISRKNKQQKRMGDWGVNFTQIFVFKRKHQLELIISQKIAVDRVGLQS